jgi:hypothetical protein
VSSQAGTLFSRPKNASLVRAEYKRSVHVTGQFSEARRVHAAQEIGWLGDGRDLDSAASLDEEEVKPLDDVVLT